jgi:hypothetical protein
MSEHLGAFPGWKGAGQEQQERWGETMPLDPTDTEREWPTSCMRPSSWALWAKHIRERRGLYDSEGTYGLLYIHGGWLQELPWRLLLGTPSPVPAPFLLVLQYGCHSTSLIQHFPGSAAYPTHLVPTQDFLSTLTMRPLSAPGLWEDVVRLPVPYLMAF